MMSAQRVTAAQAQVLAAVADGKVRITDRGHRLDLVPLSGQAFAACKRRGWVEANFAAGAWVLTDTGRHLTWGAA